MKRMISKKAEPAIEVRNISKEFLIPKLQNNSLKQAIVHGFKKSEKIRRQVLDDISFTINKGDFFGIVGRNGSGKSTLLKLICGIYTPTSGEIIKHGAITPFIELGVGFNPELSGRDNVYLNGALLGFDRKQMDEMYDEIVDFAELHEFMDLKLKNFSSGMQVRLAFSIAIKSKSPILVFDEVLAVGDEAFQRKCLDVFEEYKANGQTVVLVTHDMGTVKKFCNRAVLIQDGKLAEDDDPVVVANSYSDLNQEVIDKNIVKRNAKNSLNDKIKFIIRGMDGKKKNSFCVGEKMRIDIGWPKEIDADRILVDIFKKSGEHVTNFVSSREGIDTLIGKRSVALEVVLNLTPGSYYFAIGFWTKNFKKKIGGVTSIAEFLIKEDWSLVEHEFAGTTSLVKKWMVEK